MTSAPTRRFVGLLVAALLIARPQAQTPSAPPPPQSAQPVFKASTDVIVIDVAVTNDTGDAVSGLTPADFKLEVDGKPRRVVSAQFLDNAESTKTTTGASGAPATKGGAESFSSNESVSGGRLVLFVFDLEGHPARRGPRRRARRRRVPRFASTGRSSRPGGPAKRRKRTVHHRSRDRAGGAGPHHGAGLARASAVPPHRPVRGVRHQRRRTPSRSIASSSASAPAVPGRAGRDAVTVPR